MNRHNIIFYGKLFIFSLLLFCTSGLFAQFAGGSGTEGDPYLVQTAAQLDSVRYYLGSSFRQIADINLYIDPYYHGWCPIAGNPLEVDSFNGRYNGAGYRILSMILYNSIEGPVGLFANTNNAVLDSICLIVCSLNGTDYTGLLVGYAFNTTIKNCSVEGSIYSSGTCTGGLIGSCQESSIKNCSVDCSISSPGACSGGLIGFCQDSYIENCNTYGIIRSISNSGGFIGQNINTYVRNCSANNINVFNNYTSLDMNSIGGFIGYNSGNSLIEFCKVTGFVSAVYSHFVGGFIGANYSPQTIRYCSANVYTHGDYIVGGFIGCSGQGSIENCYAMGDVSGHISVSGFIDFGFGTVINCYSTGYVNGYSGFMGSESEASVVSSYWDINTSGSSTSNGGIGKFSYEMKVPHAINTFVDWDWLNVWRIDYTESINYGYPYLQEGQITSNEDDNNTTTSPLVLNNYPNPFTASTTIKFILAKNDKVAISIYNIKGQLIKTLSNNYLIKGEHNYEWNGCSDNGKAVPSGVYVYKLKGKDFEFTRKMTLMK